MTKKKQNSLMRKRTVFEWGILIASVIAICSIGVGLLFYSFSFKPGPPDLRVTVLPVGDHEGRFSVRVDNRGGTTAEDVVVEVTSGDQTQEVEFRAIPKGESEEAFLEIDGPSRPTARVKAFKES